MATSSRRIHAVVGLTITLDLMGLGLILPLKPFFAESFGASAVQVTLLTACFALAQMLFAPLWGRASDRFGRRPVILTSIAINACAYLAFAAAETLTALFLARIVAGFASASIPAAQAVISDTTPAGKRASGMGIIGAAFGIGFIIGPVLGGTLAQLDPRAPALVAAALAAVNFLMAARWLPETRPVRAALPTVTDAAPPQTWLPPAFWRLVGLLLMVKAAMALTEQCVGLLIEQTWVTAGPPETIVAQAAGLTSVVLVAVGLVAVAVQTLVIGRAVTRLGEGTVIAVGATLSGLAMLTVPLAVETRSFALLVVAFGLCAVGTSLLLPATMSALSQTVQTRHVGRAMGTAHAVSGLGRVVGPVCAGWLFQTAELAPFVLAAALFLVVPMVATVRASQPHTHGPAAQEGV
ncbi:MAG: DHA1 family tetracycline resistance protein-like MFS transporter [Myxococcota bacterium]|jgi:DHA1 family tetracycline resistance protein-like MFS transporter